MPPPLHFGTVLDQKLIKLVRENPLLYNPEHPMYSSSDAKELTWQKISDALGRPTAEFAGIQCQIQFGDYNEEKHKPGFIENQSEYLPVQYCSSWGIEKKILKEYSTHAGLHELDAKHLYTKTARALPTYGVTFFLVKEKQKGKKKLVPRLLGINADAILRLDETSKEIIQTWPLTHVKTYHAGKGETFTLNFGDYTDKEYSVKTRDAFRIRDILEGYIDLIRKRMLAHYNISTSDHGYVGQDNISRDQASVVQHISNNPCKVVEESFMGPSKIVEHEPGQVASQGTQMASAQQMIINEMKNKQEQGVLKAEVGTRQDMGVQFTRRLNRLNSNSVQIVTLLTEPSKAHIEDAQKIVNGMNADMPSIRDGVTGTIAKQNSEDEKKKLQDQLNELDELMRSLSQATDPASVNASEAEDAAKRIATLSTEMYFAVAPQTRRRSRILSKSRSSFIADEKTEKHLRRASFIAASATANHALDSASELAQEAYGGPALSPQQGEELERAAVDKLGKINAAIAHYTLAHYDPQNIDYAAAVNSLNTIHELMPDLARDAQALSSVKDGKDRSALINDIKELCAAAKHVCSLSGVDDTPKLQEATSKYGDVAGRLVYVFGKRGAKPRADKENQILDLAEAVVDKTSALLGSTQELTRLAAGEPAAADVGGAGARTATAATNLHTQAMLNAPTIHEPHCQSALTAASEALSSAAQHLAGSWKPLVEHPSRHVAGEKLHNQTMDLAKALDRLTEAFGSSNDTQEVQGTAEPGDEAQRLQFINSLSKVGGNCQAAEDDLSKPLGSAVSDSEEQEAQRQLAGRIAQLNAALAALLSATSDRENPDYATADAAITTINELMPQLVQDSKVASANQDEASKAALLDDIKAMCAATKCVCASAYGAEPTGLNDALIQFTNSSGKLTYVCNRRANPDRESKIIDATSAACAQAGVLLSGVQQLSEEEGGDVGEKLDAQGAALAGAAQDLLTSAQVTAASISDPRCQSTLFSTIDKVSSASKAVEETWAPLKADPTYETRLKALEAARKQLEKQLERLRGVCRLPDNEIEESQTLEVQSVDPQVGWKMEGQTAVDGAQEQQKLQFVANMRGAKEKLADAQKELNKPAMPAKGSDTGAVKQRLTQNLEQLNAAVAALLAATADRENPDCATAEKAADTISKLMPQLIKDTKTVSATMDEPARAAMLAEIKALCDASQAVCASSYGEDSTQQNVNDAVVKYAEAAGKLVFVANPRRSMEKKDQIVKLARSACGETSALLPDLQQLAEGAGGARGRGLHAQGGRLASAAQSLLQSAQVLSASLPSRPCQEALVSAADGVSSAGQQLADSVAPLQREPAHGPRAALALQALQRLQRDLDALRAACRDPGSQELAQEQQKLQFIEAVEAAKENWADAQKELKKPVAPARDADVRAVEARLSQRLAALDAAVAALLAATADRDKPSYAEAEKSVKTISELLPHIVQDSKTVCASREEGARAAMLAEVAALCDASRAVCASSYGEHPQDVNDAVAKFANASGKLVFVANPRRNLQKQNEITKLAGAACGETSALLAGVQQLAEGAGGARGRELDAQGGRLADQAQHLLNTVQITAPSVSSPECRAALLSAADGVSSAGQQLADSVAPLQREPAHGPRAALALQALQRLQRDLDALRAACRDPGSQELAQEQQKLQFIEAVEAAKENWADAQKELKKPVAPARDADVRALEARLSQRLAALDAAVAALLAATADRDKPSYAEAEKSVKTISELLPHIVQDSKTVCASREEGARAAMLAEVAALCDASRAVCASSYGEHPQDVNDAVAMFADASGKLVFVANPRRNLQKQNEITKLAGAACGETSALLAGVQQLAEGAGGARGRELDAQGGRLADQAQHLLNTAQITGKSLSSPECRAALLSSVGAMSDSAEQLSHTLAAVSADPKHSAQAQKLIAALKQLQDQLHRLSKTCDTSDVAPCKKPPLPASKPPSLVAHASPQGSPQVELTRDFLERMRCEEGMAHQTPSSRPGPAVVGGVDKVKPPPPARKAGDEKQRAAFAKSLEDAEGTIKKHESALMKQCRSPSGAGPALSHRDMMEKQAQLQRQLAQAGVEVADLVAANYADKIDYTAASKSTKALPQLMTNIVEEGTQLSDNLNELARKAFLYDMLQMCDAARKICDAAGTDRQKLNDAAVHFGDTSTKLLYVVSSDVDPALEQEIISRAKAIGDSASRLALDAANVATAASGTAASGNAASAASSSVQEICDAGTACVDAAGKLVYTAKLTAPSIHERASQEALVASTDTLSTKLRSFAGSWKPLESDPQQAKTISHLSAEATNLESILEGLRSDVREGNIGRRRELEHLVIEDTPLRQLTVKILEEAKAHAEAPSVPTPQKIAYAAYADKGTEALRALDLANARCKKTPHDTDKRRDLEAAIQNLQMILLQSRPSRGDKGKSNIVDLMDFMEEVCTEAKNASSAASSARVPIPKDKRTLEEIKEKCDNIETKANQLIRGEVSSDLDFNDLFDQFGQECDDVIKQLTKEVRGMEDVKAKTMMQSKVMALSESCNLLRFATKSGISTEACATLDASLDELDDIEDRVIKSVVQDASTPRVPLRPKLPPGPGQSAATVNLCREVTSSPAGVAPATVTAYIADAASRADITDPEENKKLLKHLYKLVHLLKTLTVSSSARAATWRPAAGPHAARLTDQILQEIYNPESKFGETGQKKQKILNEDIAKLLIPSAPRMLGDHKQQEAKLTQLAAELSTQCGALLHDTSRASLPGAAQQAADVARDLDGIARGANITDPVQRRKIDEAAKEMSFYTYNVLTTAECVCLEPKNSALKRRLAEALQNLNNSIDKLVWHASSAPVLQRQCGALSRGTATQLAALQPRPHSAAPFADTCDLIAKQNENISKLKSDQPMPRKEFMRNLDDIGTAVRNSVEGAEQCAYYIAVSEKHKDIAKVGVADVPKIQLALESVQDACMAIISASEYDQAKEQKEELHKRVLDFSNALDQAQMQAKDGEVKKTLVRAKTCVSEAAESLKTGLERQNSMDKVTPHAVSLLEAVNEAHSMIEHCPLVPPVGTLSKETQEKCDEVMNHSKSLLSNTLSLLKDVNSAPEEPEMMTWVTFDSNRKKLLDAYDALLKSVRRNGHRAGIYEKAPEEEKEEIRKSYIETQVELANKWLKSPACKTEVKVIGQQAARNVVDMARQMSEDLKGSEREEVRNVITETEELLSECSKKYDHEKNSVLMDRLKELRKSIQRGVVTRVVEDFIEAEEPLADLDLLTDLEQDETKRKFILERKIASLLAQLGRVTKTARFVANSSQQQSIGVELSRSSEQTELLAPMLVKAAQQRIDHPDDKALIENYKALLAQYAESISKVRDLCDRAVDPMDFVQTAGDTMQRMREDVTLSNSDPQKCAYTSNAITKLANRVINVSMSSNAVASDPELQKALIAAKQRLHAVTPAPNTRASRVPDWRDTTAEILRTTGDVESALGGENIFKKEPTTANQPIYSVARDLHESVREWSSRDNEIVGVARRMAVLMARLSEYMETDKTDALIATSKSIVMESQEVAELAKKLAHECSDVRIKTNLLQTCERIPTISGQLKMLTAVKAASLGQQGVEADKEAMDMLVVNAQSLMLSIQEVVKAAAGASVKIMSQRGPRLRWVRKNYY